MYVCVCEILSFLEINAKNRMSNDTDGSIAKESLPCEEAIEILPSLERSTRQASDMQDNDTDGVPYDRGWAWMVVVGENFFFYFKFSDWTEGN